MARRNGGPRILVVPVNTFSVLWASDVLKSVMWNRSGTRFPAWMGGSIIDLGVLIRWRAATGMSWLADHPELSTDGVGSKSGVPFDIGTEILNLANKANTAFITPHHRNIQTYTDSGALYGLQRKRTLLDRTPVQVMGQTENGDIIVFVLAGAWPHTDDNHGQALYPFILPHTQRDAWLEGLVYVHARYPKLPMTFVLPESEDSDSSGANTLEQHLKSNNFTLDWAAMTRKLIQEREIPKGTTEKAPKLSFQGIEQEEFYGAPAAIRELGSKRNAARTLIAAQAPMLKAQRERLGKAGRWSPVGIEVPTLEELSELYGSRDAAAEAELLSVGYVASLDGKKREKSRHAATRRLDKITKPDEQGLTKNSIPWVTIEQAAFTPYGINRETGSYDPLTTVVLSRDDIFGIIKAARNDKSLKADGDVFNMQDAILAEVSKRSGMDREIETYLKIEKRPPITFSMLAAVTVRPIAKNKSGGYAQVPWGSRSGLGLPGVFNEQAGRYGVHLDKEQRFVLARTSLNHDEGLPVFSPWRDPSDQRYEYLGVYPGKKPESTLVLAKNVVGVQPQNTGAIQAVEHTNLFGFDRIAGQGEWEGKAFPPYVEALAWALRKSKKGNPAYKAYYSVIQRDLGQSFSRVSSTVRAGQAARAARPSLGKSMGKNVKGKVVPRDQNQALTSEQLSFSGPYRLADKILKETQEIPNAKVGTDIHPEYGIPRALITLMEQIGIPLPEKMDKESTTEALMALNDQVAEHVSTTYEPYHGRLQDQGSDEQQDFLSKLNPRGRRARKPRRPRRGQGRRNPMSEEDAAEAASWLAGGSPEEQSKRAESLQKKFKGGDPWASPDITPGVRETFRTRKPQIEIASRQAPDPYSAKDFAPSKRLRGLSQSRSDILGTVRAPVYDPVAAAAFNELIYPWREASDQGEESLQYLSARVPLSLEEVGGILYNQQESKKHRPAMQASSALTKQHRSLRADYMPGSEIFDIVGKNALIVMGPIKEPARVMTFKRGVHMDADMVGPDMGRLTGLSLQAVILWLAEKPTRKTGAVLWLGRVGSPLLYRLWEGQNSRTPISLVSIQDALRGGSAESISDVAAEREETKYLASVAKLANQLSRRAIAKRADQRDYRSDFDATLRTVPADEQILDPEAAEEVKPVVKPVAPVVKPKPVTKPKAKKTPKKKATPKKTGSLDDMFASLDESEVVVERLEAVEPSTVDYDDEIPKGYIDAMDVSGDFSDEDLGAAQLSEWQTKKNPRRSRRRRKGRNPRRSR